MKKLYLVLFVLLLSSNTYAVDNPNVQQGASDYDWQSCFNAKNNACKNSCTTSSDIDCAENCNDMATDKCTAQGYQKPQGLNDADTNTD